ncbi:MAG: T9SS type A sorting domain-containing protein [Saprospiraceae bacterium]|nr:T9SS type A sorting domain-containing protein [Saprospiraceae bacterium]
MMQRINGDNVYTSCAVSGNGPGSGPGQGLYNKAELDKTGDGQTDITDDACGDIPNVIMRKDFVGTVAKANGSFDVSYAIIVNNTGGATGTYSLKDTPLFDTDVVINSGTYGGQASGNMNTGGSTTLGTGVSIAALATQTYNVTFNVTLKLDDAVGLTGDNVYTSCAVSGNGPGSGPGQGLYNKAELDRTGDGVTDITDDACGDLPFITMVKDLVQVTPFADGSYIVRYEIRVKNIGGASGQYSLKDSPLFDNDVTIESWDYTFVDVDAGIGNGPAFIGAPIIPINLGGGLLTAGNSHIYNISFRVRLNLEPGSNDPGDNLYTSCAVSGNGPGSGPGQGLYNKAEVDRTGDGVTDITDDACGDLPNVIMRKDFVGTVAKANGSFDVSYAIIVNNTGGATGTYSLKDTPLFDTDVVINSGTYGGQASGSMLTSGPTTLGTGVSIAAAATQTYNVTFNVTLKLDDAIGLTGDNLYTSCAVSGNGPGSGPGQGLYNKAELDKTGDGQTDITDDACGDLPNVIMRKDFVGTVAKANGSFDVSYAIVVNNTGGATGTYSLKDTPLFDTDVVINSGTYGGQASGSMLTSGPTTLGTGVSIAAAATQTYNVTFNVTLKLDDAVGLTGDNVYTSCAVSGNGPGSGPGQGLYNKAELDKTGDGQTDITDDACGDIPNITLRKDFVSAVAKNNGTYDVSYKIIVNNNGGATGTYSLKDTPLFDADVVINSGTYGGQASGGMNTSGSTTLGTGVSIAISATHTYNITFNVTLKLDDAVGLTGDNVYTPCEESGSEPGQGLYNKADLDWTGDGQTDLTDDACGDLPGSIGNFVWDDLNANGIQDGGEPGIGSVLVRLFNSVGTQISTKVTDTNGFYLFTNLGPGTYTVKFDKPIGYEPTQKDRLGDDAKDSDADLINGITAPIVLDAGENDLTIDAGYYKLARLGDFVWEDRDADGIQDNLEPGIPNVTVNLAGTDAFGRSVTQSTTTNGTGLYEFVNLVPGSYTVTFVKPGVAYKASPADTPANDAKDSDANVLTGTSPVTVLVSGDNNETIDAGFYRCAYVGDFVWLDVNANNLQDAGDVGLNNVKVELYSTANPASPVQSMLTIDDPRNPGKKGYYTFEVCQVGTYFIKVLKNDSLNFVTPNIGPDDAIDSDIVDFINKRTLTFTVLYAAVITDIDAGLKYAPLPVDMKSFTGRWNKERDVNELDWITLLEINNAYFEIERSFEGGTFEKIGKIAGSGNSNSALNYSFDDEEIAKDGVYIYRLRQVDLDGRAQYSDEVIVRVDRNSLVKTSIYPNPSAGNVSIEISALEGSDVRADVYDNTGRLVIRSLINSKVTNYSLSATIDSGILREGVYFIMVNIDGAISSHKLIIIE